MTNKKSTILGAAAAFTLVMGCAVNENSSDDVVTSEQHLTCADTSGLNPYKAALAVAMAEELGSLDPSAHLTWAGNIPSSPWFPSNPGRLALSNTAKSICDSKGGCPNTQAILDMQDSSVGSYIPSYEFNLTNLANDLYVSLDRQRQKTADLRANNPELLPGAHSLVLKQEDDLGGCGIHFTFDVSKDGSSSTSSSSTSTCTNVRPTGTGWDAATCDMWASQTNECNQSWMIEKNYCNQSCGRCSATTTTTSSCTDVRPTGTTWDAATCWDWANRTNECSQSWMIEKNYCNASCGRCSTSTSSTSTTSSGDWPVSNLYYNLVFFGVQSGNDYIDFRATESTIAIDPTVGLNGTTQTSGSCGYGFTVYDPTWWSYGKCCYYSGSYGTWAVAPWAADTFYCKR